MLAAPDADLCRISCKCLYLRDFTNETLQSWWVDNMLVGALADSGAVDGCFTDDVAGFGAEHAAVMERTGISVEKVHALQVATQQVWTRALQKLIDGGGYNWQVTSMLH